MIKDIKFVVQSDKDLLVVEVMKLVNEYQDKGYNVNLQYQHDGVYKSVMLVITDDRQTY